MTAPFNPEELCDQTLIGSIRMLMKDDSVFPEIFSAAFENRNAKIKFNIFLFGYF